MRVPVLVAALSFALTAAVIHRALPSPPTQITRKLDLFQRHADDYTAVFVGTSLVYRQIDPLVFDGELRRAGIASRSFNFGAPAMVLGEALYLIEELLTHRPARLRTLFLDGELLDFSEPENQLTRRNIAWHEPRIAGTSIAALLRSPNSLVDRATHGRDDLRALASNAFNVGAFASRFEDDPEELLSDGIEGYVPLDQFVTAERSRRRTQFLAQTTAYLAEVARLRDQPRSPSAPSAYRARLTRQILARCRASGVTPILVHGPVPWPTERLDDDTPVLDLQDPRREPELFDPDLRFDRGHLNRRGATLYSRQLAQRFVEWTHAVH